MSSLGTASSPTLRNLPSSVETCYKKNSLLGRGRGAWRGNSMNLKEDSAWPEFFSTCQKLVWRWLGAAMTTVLISCSVPSWLFLRKKEFHKRGPSKTIKDKKKRSPKIRPDCRAVRNDQKTIKQVFFSTMAQSQGDRQPPKCSPRGRPLA